MRRSTSSSGRSRSGSASPAARSTRSTGPRQREDVHRRWRSSARRRRCRRRRRRRRRRPDVEADLHLADAPLDAGDESQLLVEVVRVRVDLLLPITSSSSRRETCLTRCGRRACPRVAELAYPFFTRPTPQSRLLGRTLSQSGCRCPESPMRTASGRPC